MDFLTTAQKLKKLRKDLKMKQEDLTASCITRGFISMVESGKRGMSYNSAQVIADIFNKRSKELNSNLCIDANYILRTPSEDAEIYCLEKLDAVNSITDIEDIVKISREFNLDDISVKAYHKLGDLQFSCNNYSNAFANYNFALELCKKPNNTKSEVYLYNSIGKCKLKMLQYTDAIFYFERANYYAVLYDNSEIYRISMYNLALCFKKLNRIDAALKYLNDILKLFDKNINFTEYVYVNILRANCYEIQNYDDKSIEIYNELIKKISNERDPLLGMIYNNLGLIYLKEDDYAKSLDYFNLAQQLRVDSDRNNLHHTIIEKSNVFIKQKLYNEAILIIKSGLEMASQYNDTEYLLKGNYLLVQIYNILNDYTNLQAIYNVILDLLDITKDEGQILKLYNIMSLMYLKHNNLEKVENCLEMSRTLIDKCFNYDL